MQLKVLIISDIFVPRIGGTEIQASRLAGALHSRGHEVEVWTGHWEHVWPQTELIENVPVVRIQSGARILDFPGLRRFAQLVYMWNLSRRLAGPGRHFDIIHVQSMRYGAAIAARFGARHGRPVLVKETNSGAKNSYLGIGDVFLGGWLLRNLHRHLRHVAVLNELAELEYARYPFANLRIHRCVNGIVLPPRVERGDEPATKRLLFVGRFRREKGVRLLLRAWDLVADRMPDWTLRIVGDGEERAEVEELLSTIQGRDRVELPGYSRNPGPELREATAFVLPSAAEGMSNALLEAMSASLPCVASDVGANREMLSDSSGWIFADRTAESLAAALLEMAASGNERARRGRRARDRVEANYSMAASIRRYEEIYDELRATADRPA